MADDHKNITIALLGIIGILAIVRGVLMMHQPSGNLQLNLPTAKLSPMAEIDNELPLSPQLETGGIKAGKKTGETKTCKCITHQLYKYTCVNKDRTSYQPQCTTEKDRKGSKVRCETDSDCASVCKPKGQQNFQPCDKTSIDFTCVLVDSKGTITTPKCS